MSTAGRLSRVVLLGLVLASAADAAAQPVGPPAAPAGSLEGRVLDSSGAVLPHAVLVIRAAGIQIATATTDAAGRYVIARLAPGRVEISVHAPGFEELTIVADVAAERRRVDITLEVGGLSDNVQVVADRVVASDAAMRRIPGSIDVLDMADIEVNRVLTTAEALRKAAGVHVRDEEGFALRPNIGIRGLNPTRSSRVLLLEDGIPLTYAPYGDNASYYHPPIERFERIELLKGSGQIAYGPMTVGGVINYVTPTPPASPAGSFVVSVGNRDYFNAQGGWGTTLGRSGFFVDFMRKQGDGSRENTATELNDVNAKLVSRLTDHQTLTARVSYYGEDSNLTYSGLRQAEFDENPRQNPFANDFFYVDRIGASVTHNHALRSNVAVTTNLYVSNFQRDWWRQSSNSSQRPNDAGDPACGGMANLHTTCGNEGRLREYVVWGIEPRVRATVPVGALLTETDAGVRAHFEDQERRQENGATPIARSGALVENNNRRNDAYSGFLQTRLIYRAWSVTPGIRYERVNYERTNRLLNVSGASALTEWIPGVGAAFSPNGRLTTFAGIHRGFTPPRTEDIINNTTGGVVELDPERSWNVEAGVRSRLRGVDVDATFFRMDYANQVIPATLAGGVGSALTNAGETLHQGVELGMRANSAAFHTSQQNVYLRLAYTWLPIARFEGTRFSSLSGFGTVSVTGNRLPYAPEHLLTAGVGYRHTRGLDTNIEAVLIGQQYGDDLNTVAPTADGQRGVLPGYTLWNAAVNHPVSRHAAVFVTAKNLFDRLEIVDRARGILPTAPRMIQAGVKVRF